MAHFHFWPRPLCRLTSSVRCCSFPTALCGDHHKQLHATYMALHVNQSQHRHNPAVQVTSRIDAPETMRMSSIAVMRHSLPRANAS
jgi:hypothetical protein